MTSDTRIHGGRAHTAALALILGPSAIALLACTPDTEAQPPAGGDDTEPAAETPADTASDAVDAAADLAVDAEWRDFRTEATIVEVMESTIMPSAQVVWDAHSVTITSEGTVESKPETAEDWERLRWSAVTLAESANSLIIPGRAVDQPGAQSEFPGIELHPADIQARIEENWEAWVGYSHALHATAMEAVQVIDARNVDRLWEVGSEIYAACESCHMQFWYPEGNVPPQQ